MKTYIPMVLMGSVPIPLGVFSDKQVAWDLCREYLQADNPGVEIHEDEHGLVIEKMATGNLYDGYVYTFDLDDLSRANRDIEVVKKVAANREVRKSS